MCVDWCYNYVIMIFIAVDPMSNMIASIRSGNVALKKVQRDTKVSKLIHVYWSYLYV